MSTPTNPGPYESRVMIEVIKDGIPRRVHVWTHSGKTFIGFPQNMTEDEATAMVAQAMTTVRAIDVSKMFREPTGKRRRLIESGD